MKNRSNTYYWILIVMSFCLYTLSSCKKDRIDGSSDVRLGFQTDTLTFDTVFVSLGSTTKSFTVRNTNNQPVEINKVYLKGNQQSPFRLTIDGDATNSAEKVYIPAKDSIYIFVEVTVDPNDEFLPFVIEDEVVFDINGNQQKVVLQAYGQNAHFFNGDVIQTQVWTNDLPYVILNSIELEKGHTLTIQEGTTVYFGGNSGMFINGTLRILGGSDTSQWVTFRGYRLDRQVTGVPYDRLPGQWLGLFLMRESKNNEIEYFRMRGSQYGINVGNTTFEELNNVSMANAPDLKITNSAIYNSSVYGLYGFLAKIEASNLLIYDAGRNAFCATLGGEYTFKHSNFLLKSSNFFDHKESSFYVSDYHIYDKNSPALQSNLSLQLINSIVYGTIEDELLLDVLDKNNVNVTIENNLIRTKSGLPPYVQSSNNILNEEAGMEDFAKNDFRLKSTSILIDKGQVTDVVYDITGKMRESLPDIGAYEH